MGTKSQIYGLLRTSNDINAIAKGKAGQRILRRMAGKSSGHLFRRLFR